jgi:hypothetical protein
VQQHVTVQKHAIVQWRVIVQRCEGEKTHSVREIAGEEISGYREKHLGVPVAYNGIVGKIACEIC